MTIITEFIWKEFKDALSGKIYHTEFSILSQYGDDGQDVITDTLPKCIITKMETSAKQDDDNAGAMKLDIQIEAMPWKRARILVEEYKKSDGYFTAYTKTRIEDLKLVASKKPFYITNIKMHTWKGNPKIAALSQLKNIDDLLKIHDIQHIFLRGSGYHEEQFKDAKSIDDYVRIKNEW